MVATRRPVTRQHAQGAIVGLAVAAAIVGGGYAARTLTGGNASSLPPASPARQILALINQRRAKLHLAPLKRDVVLASLAHIHSHDMIVLDEFSHDKPQLFTERLAFLHRRLVGEVIAFGTGGYATPAGIVSLWFSSPEHKRILLTPAMRRIGISIPVARLFQGQTHAAVATADLSN